jgi:hypothetical protein
MHLTDEHGMHEASYNKYLQTNLYNNCELNMLNCYYMFLLIWHVMI